MASIREELIDIRAQAVNADKLIRKRLIEDARELDFLKGALCNVVTIQASVDRALKQCDKVAQSILSANQTM